MSLETKRRKTANDIPKVKFEEQKINMNKQSATTTSNNPSTGTTNAVPVTTGTTTTSTNCSDNKYFYNDNELQELKIQKPWMNDSKYLSNVAISPSAVIKIMNHCTNGVERGIAKGGNPIEVMGLLLGRPDPINTKCLIVTDAYPLPIEGFETRVVADDDNVTNYMIQLGELLEVTRYEKFMGWYHSHPFEYMKERTHCFLSQTDLSTQLQWQRLEDPHGNPFVAIVVDPIRSTVVQQPTLKAFRAYPPEYTSTIQYECPDGTIEPNEHTRIDKWGSCWMRYYELNVEYFMSNASRTVLETMTKDYLWIRKLEGETSSSSTSTATLTSQLVSCKNTFINAKKSTSNTTGSTTTTAAASNNQKQQQQSGIGSSSSSVAGGIMEETMILNNDNDDKDNASSSLRSDYSNVFDRQGLTTSSSSSKMKTNTKQKGVMNTTNNKNNANSDKKGTVTELTKAIEQLATINTEQMIQRTLHDAKKCIFTSVSTTTTEI